MFHIQAGKWRGNTVKNVVLCSYLISVCIDIGLISVCIDIGLISFCIDIGLINVCIHCNDASLLWVLVILVG